MSQRRTEMEEQICFSLSLYVPLAVFKQTVHIFFRIRNFSWWFLAQSLSGLWEGFTRQFWEHWHKVRWTPCGIKKTNEGNKEKGPGYLHMMIAHFKNIDIIKCMGLFGQVKYHQNQSIVIAYSPTLAPVAVPFPEAPQMPKNPLTMGFAVGFLPNLCTWPEVPFGCISGLSEDSEMHSQFSEVLEVNLRGLMKALQDMRKSAWGLRDALLVFGKTKSATQKAS